MKCQYDRTCCYYIRARYKDERDKITWVTAGCYPSVLRSKLPPAALICLGHLWVGGGEQDDRLEFHPDGSSSGGGGNGSRIIGDFDGGATVAVFR